MVIKNKVIIARDWGQWGRLDVTTVRGCKREVFGDGTVLCPHGGYRNVYIWLDCQEILHKDLKSACRD
jgi:hypothetical protein